MEVQKHTALKYKNTIADTWKYNTDLEYKSKPMRKFCSVSKMVSEKNESASRKFGIFILEDTNTAP